MKYLAIWHANLNYAYLTPDKYEFVIRESYELLIDTMREQFPGVKYVFEASGFSIEQMAGITPGVLEKLKHAIAKGECEFMGSPYAHPMLPNFPKRDGIWSVRFSNEVYEKHLGMRPVSFWNPECGWAAHVPEIVAETGYRNLIGDFEAYSRSKGADGKPLRPEIYDLEHTDEVKFYNFGYKFDMPGDERAIHFPFKNLEGLAPDTLRSFLRTDRICQPTERYFMGKPGYDLDHCMELIRKYSAQKPGEPEGAVIIYADDVEYVGTNGWYRLKYENKPDNTFERVPESRDRLIALISETLKLGSFITYDEACRTLPPLEDRLNFDHDSAWHGARASTWAGTPMARQLRPWQDLVREKLNASESSLDPGVAKRAWYHLTNSYNSDGQWPPTLPEAPHIVHPFDYQYCYENLVKAEALVGGVDRSRLTVKPADTLRSILRYQQDLIEKKARAILAGTEPGDAAQAAEALALLAISRDLGPIEASGTMTLDPAEYFVRADFMVAARRLVGGVRLEDVDASEKDKKV